MSYVELRWQSKGYIDVLVQKFSSQIENSILHTEAKNLKRLRLVV